MFGLIRKSRIQNNIDRAVMRVSDTLSKMHDAEKKKILAQYEDEISFLLAEKDAEIAEYCRQNNVLRDIIAQMERDKEDVKRGAIENTRIANNIDRVAKSILDVTEKTRVDMVQSISNDFKKYFETLAIHWQTTSEIINDTRTQQLRQSDEVEKSLFLSKLEKLGYMEKPETAFERAERLYRAWDGCENEDCIINVIDTVNAYREAIKEMQTALDKAYPILNNGGNK